MIKQKGKCTAEEKEILNILLEECAEVTQAISKIFRFGFESCHPETPNISNRKHLTEEIGDLMTMIMITAKKEIINEGSAFDYAEKKFVKLELFSDINLKGIKDAQM
jgi:NTP pyrophosphatase (non-canonical NTP hydrolase)